MLNKNAIFSKFLKMVNKKSVLSAAAVIFMVGTVTMTAAADADNRAANIKSKGAFDYKNGTAVIDASDLTYLANEIDNLEDTYKSKTLESLNSINTYFKIDGSITHNAAESGINTSAADILTFDQLNNGIRSSQASSNAPESAEILAGNSAWANGVMIIGSMPNNGATGRSNLAAGSSYTIPAGYTTGGTVTAASLASQTSSTATAANLSQGVTAWVNGVMITGTGADNNSYYNQGYQQGVDVATPQLLQSNLVGVDPSYTVQNSGKAVITYVMFSVENYDCNTNVSRPGFTITLDGQQVYSDYAWNDYAAQKGDVAVITCATDIEVTAGQTLSISNDIGYLCTTECSGSITEIY